MFRSSTLLAGVCLLAATSWPPHAHAEVRRCLQPDGDVSYTDHRCADIGAVERPAGDGGAATDRLYRGGCPRTLQDLLFEMTQAIHARDANRLAGLYHWAGMSSSAADPVMQQFEALVQQPLVDVVPVMSSPAGGFPGLDHATSWGGHEARPVAVRIEQTLAGTITPSRTVFGLHRYFGCVWIRNARSG